jgi:hypothetical protein
MNPLTGLKYTVLALFLGCAAPFTRAQATHPVPTEAELSTLAALLPATPKGVGSPITNRAAWADLAKIPGIEGQTRLAEKLLTEPIAPITEELRGEFARTGKRETFERAATSRTLRLAAFTLAEGVENKGRYLPAIEEVFTAILDETTWVMPASYFVAKDRPENLPRTVDLAAANRAWTLTTVDHLLGTRLSPALRTRFRAEMQRRVFEPYAVQVRTGTPYWFWFDAHHNWNAVCHAGVISSALALIESRQERALYLRAAQIYLPTFIGGFSDDGFSPEGLGYWGYGFSNYLALAETIYQATSGRLNLFTGDKMRNIAAVAQRLEIAPGLYLTYGDSSLKYVPPQPYFHYISDRFGLTSPLLRPLNGDDLRITYFAWWSSAFPVFTCFHFPLPAYGPGPGLAANVASGGPSTVGEDSALRSILSGAQFVTLRSAPGTVPFLGLSLRGGHNDEGHNHNDNGTYAVAVGSKLLILDPGTDLYNNQTFSSRRYESAMMNSFGHPVPVVAGQLQRTGAESKGTLISTDFTPDLDRVVMDLTSSYDVPELKKLTRTWIFDRTQSRIEILDTAEFTEPRTLGTAVITLSPWEKTAPATVVIRAEDSALNVAFTTASGESVTVRNAPVNGFYNDLGANPAPKTTVPTRLGVTAAPALQIELRTTLTLPEKP